MDWLFSIQNIHCSTLLVKFQENQFPKDSCKKKKNMCVCFIAWTLKFIPSKLLEEFWGICGKTKYFYLMNFILCL